MSNISTFCVILTYILKQQIITYTIKPPKKGGTQMNSKKKVIKSATNIAKKVAEHSAILDTFGTTCIYYYQPKVPAVLRERRKTNDK